MKNKITLSLISTIIVSVLLQTSGNEVHSNTSGSPAGRTGSPTDGFTCATSSCHNTTASVSLVQIISSNVPVSGYIPGQTYTLTATMTQTGISKFGFQISPQDMNGNKVGNIIVTNVSNTKIVSTKYITHTSAGSTGSGTKSWTFDWQAPSVGTGDVIFYGAFNFANNSGTSSGDIIRTNTLTITEDLGTAGIFGIEGDQLSTILFPNPLTEQATLRVQLQEQEKVNVQIYSLSGQTVSESMLFTGTPGLNEFNIQMPNGLPSGAYKMMVSSGTFRSMKTFLKK